eukprot:gene21362-25675_t
MSRYVAFALLVSLSCAPQASSLSKGVNVALTAKWQATPILLEAAEFFAEESSQLFWQFIETWNDAGSPEDLESCRELILSRASSFSSSNMNKMLDVALAMRKYSPKLELFRSLAEQSLAAQGDKGEVATSPAELHGLLKTGALGEAGSAVGTSAIAGSAPLTEVDHVYPGSPSSGVQVILYASPGTECFASFHAELAALATSSPGIQYVLRPVLFPGCGAGTCAALGTGGALQIPGYGVELAIKNMEYKAQDDQKVKAEGDEEGGAALEAAPQ